MSAVERPSVRRRVGVKFTDSIAWGAVKNLLSSVHPVFGPAHHKGKSIEQAYNHAFLRLHL